MIKMELNILTFAIIIAVVAYTNGYVVETDIGQPLALDSNPKLSKLENAENIGNEKAAGIMQSEGLCLREHNSARAANGKRPLTYDSRLEDASRNHNEVMQRQNCFSHQCSGEPPFGDRIKKAGYNWSGAAENIFSGVYNCRDAVNGWMNSPGHRANILGDYQNVGCHQLDKYFTCDFARGW